MFLESGYAMIYISTIFMFIRSSFENVKLIVYCLSGMGSHFAVL